MTLDNCPRCGKLFARTFRDVCHNCYVELEKDYQRTADYLREHRGITIHELSEAVGVSIRQITRWIREGRISLYNAPNLSYPCEVCGILIREGTMCDACRKRLAKEVKRVQEASRHPAPERPARDETYRISDRLRNR